MCPLHERFRSRIAHSGRPQGGKIIANYWNMPMTLARKLYWRRYLARNARPWEELEQFPKLSAGEQRRILAEKLLSQVRYFAQREDALPEWRQAAADIRHADELWRIWPSLPVMTKEMVRTRFSAKSIGQCFGIAGHVDSSGGSTGE